MKGVSYLLRLLYDTLVLIAIEIYDQSTKTILALIILYCDNKKTAYQICSHKSIGVTGFELATSTSLR